MTTTKAGGGGYSAGYSDSQVDPLTPDEARDSASGIIILLEYSSEQQYPACGENQQERNHTGGDYDYLDIYVHSGQGAGVQACYGEDNLEQPGEWVSTDESEDACGSNFDR